ncbi:MAG TPA: hypothetical protein VMI94_24305 [Bryobacteraceae bacterium]|nr:hypothetical protein [Bryobacteraceae bacterium]
MLERLAVLVGGFAAGALLRRWQDSPLAPPRSLERTARELQAQMRAHEHRLRRLENRAETHEARLNDLPSARQLASAMDELLGKAMSGLDARLAAQAQSIEALRATVTQTDELLERVLESLDLLSEQ